MIKSRRRLLTLYLLLLTIVLAVMMILRREIINRRSSPRDYREIRAEGVLRIVTQYDQSGFFVSGDTIGGFQYELSRAISELSGLEIRIFLAMSLSESFSGLSDRRYDVIARNIPATSELKDDYLFTDPLILDRQVLVQRTAAANHAIAPIRNQLDLAGKTLYIPEHSPALFRLINLRHEIGDTIHIIRERRYSSEQLIILVACGDIDYAVCDQQTADIARKSLPEIDTDTHISFTQLQSWAVRKESPVLRDSLNGWFSSLRERGVYDAIYRRYYGHGNPSSVK
jgi:membrane-bound lytic murein transglycosylase MltF